MVGKLNSPGILVREVDNTAFAPTIDSSIIGVVGFADKGPINKATLITNAEQLVKTFGEPNEALPGQGLIGALEILEATNRIYFVRCASGEVEASAAIPLVASPAVWFDYDVISSINPLFLSVEVSVDGEAIQTSSLIEISSTEATIGDNFKKYVGDGTANKDLFAASVDPISANYPYVYASLAGKNVSIKIVAASANNFTTALVDCMKAVNGVGEPTGALSSTVVTSGFEITSGLNYLVQSLYGGKGYNLGISLKTGEVTGLSVETDNIAGPWFNLYVNDKGYQNENFRLSLVGDNTYIGNVIKRSEADTPINSEFVKGFFSGTAYEGDLEALVSPAEKLTNLLDYTVSTTKITQGVGETTSATPRFVKLKTGTYPLDGGLNGATDSTAVFGANEGTAEDGTDTNLNAVVIGTAAGKTGIYALDDDNLNISVAVVPGFTNQRIQNELVTLAETSQNFLAVMAPPYGLDSVQETTDWMNGKGNGRTAALNSSYAAVYWPWVQVFSVYDEKDRWLDPAVYAVRQMAFTDSVAEPWFAPAGFNRGRLTKPIDTEKILSQGDRDSLYDNNINPMVKFFPEGITIFGQKTAKRIPSATDRINVRRLMIVLRKTLLASARSFIFEPNDAITWENVKILCEDILRDFASKRGVAEYRVICDGTVNSPLRVSRRELWCKIILRPVEAAEYIIFEVNLTNNTSKLGA